MTDFRLTDSTLRDGSHALAHQFTVDQVLRDIIGRCRELRLRLTKGERQTKLDFAIMLTVHTVHLLHRRDTWHPL